MQVDANTGLLLIAIGVVLCLIIMGSRNRYMQHLLKSKIIIDKAGCWIWQGYISKSGYGQISIKKKSYKAHRLSYQEFKGSIPAGLEIDHLCRVRNCINPGHLEAVTKKENILRGTSFAATNAKKATCPLGHTYDHKTVSGRVCSTCVKKKSATWRITNKEKENKKRRVRYKKNRDQEVESRRTHYLKNRDAILAKKRADYRRAKFSLEKEL